MAGTQSEPLGRRGEGVTPELARWPSQTRFGRLCATHWYLVAPLPYAAVVLAATMAHRPRVSRWPDIPPLNDPIFNAISLGMMAIAATYALWHRRIPQLFARLFEPGDRSSWSSSDEAVAAEKRCFRDYQKRLGFHWEAAVIALSIVIAFASWQSAPDTVLTRLAWPLRDPWDPSPVKVVLAAVMTGWACVLGTWAWVLIVTSWSIRQISRSLKLHISIGHPDGCGGMSYVGNTCALMAVMPFVGFIAYGVAYALYFPEMWLTDGNVALVLSVGALICLVFLLPTWEIHRQLATTKQDFEHWYARRLAAMIVGEMTRDKHPVSESALKAECGILDTLNPSKTNVRTWPFPRLTFLWFLVSQMVSVGTFAISLYKR